MSQYSLRQSLNFIGCFPLQSVDSIEVDQARGRHDAEEPKISLEDVQLLRDGFEESSVSPSDLLPHLDV